MDSPSSTVIFFSGVLLGAAVYHFLNRDEIHRRDESARLMHEREKLLLEERRAIAQERQAISEERTRAESPGIGDSPSVAPIPAVTLPLPTLTECKPRVCISYQSKQETFLK